mmetsp:Transcript_26214/g.68857  ORF Transcript_26214/g.68857 Transcript_26214/m.68857 type:complete len:1186 (+) Transcript_26214:139-3696(+)|eukprot:CAMPEP_0182916656 /NCGR_PEP_ID=MMETSP0105_2-20130417/1077_1 /TAXON_ID=81532 ORGANISM="Acanthoeca-like sp., Strain 10tr" /NCGR_SAMPLE_ID=MMETSP0105_2 /ASSEMBLY_ACC=CAM_ASM_000205 /LENGTH=1185 /DNA_ID=CAMNT_0025053621 /DNA_START=115 /DNA_END=3672 /DNA_ORIENTATION=-
MSTSQFEGQEWLSVVYIVSTVLFILALRGLAHETTAKAGTVYGIVGMAVAVGGTIGTDYVDGEAYWIIPVAVIPAGLLGIAYAYTVETDRLPELVGLFNAFGGLAAALEGEAVYVDRYARFSIYSGQGLNKVDLAIQLTVSFLSVIIGMMTFAGSLVAVAKLTPWDHPLHIPSRALTFPGRDAVLVLLCLGIVGVCAAVYVVDYPFSCNSPTGDFGTLQCSRQPDATTGTALMIVLAGLAGLAAVINTLGVAGSDMAVVIAVLNSGSGWGGVAAGFMIGNELMVVTGAFVGASGAILSYIMCNAMNLDILRVLGIKPPKAVKRRSNATAEEDALPDPVVVQVPQALALMREANDIIIAPGYGMAAASAQVLVGQLADHLRRMGKRVRFAIHPVAGRLPGHMNILLAEANVPYDIVMSMEEINKDFRTADLAICVGAWDTVNPVAAEDPDSPVYGMPMCKVWEAKHCIVNKRSLPKKGQSGGGFSGARNTLPYKDNTRMLLGSASQIFSELAAAMATEADHAGAGVAAAAAEAAAEDAIGSLDDLLALPTFKRVAVPREAEDDERRCAVTPAAAAKLRRLGFEVLAEAGVGQRALITDESLAAAAVTIVRDHKELMARADICLKVNPPTCRDEVHELALVPEGSTFISFVGPLDRGETEANPKTETLKDLQLARDRGLTLLGMQYVPRISRAQKCDALSTFAKIAGHRASLEGAARYGRVMAGEITAAGKNPPAVVFVAGCGVAGLEAIATCRKLGAVVRATDVRMDAVEQVASVGGEFVHPDMVALAMAQEEGGYAKPDFSPEGQAKTAAMYREQMPQCDIVITTAAIPGRPPPRLITAEMVAAMKAGAVIVDIAGGNCELTKKGEAFQTDNGVTIVGYTDYPSRMATQASEFYAANLVNLLEDMCGHPDGKGVVFDEPPAKGFWINMEITREQLDTAAESYSKGSYATGDDILAGMVLTKGGKLDYPKPPPKALSVAPKRRAAAAASAPSDGPAAPAQWSCATQIILALLGIGAAAVLGVVIAPYSATFVNLVLIFVLSSVLGYCLVAGVKPSLHTPLMSMSNAISGIVILGGLLQIQGEYLDDDRGNPTQVLGALATAVSAINVAGGFAVTFRMLSLFRTSDATRKGGRRAAGRTDATAQDGNAVVVVVKEDGGAANKAPRGSAHAMAHAKPTLGNGIQASQI